MSRLEATEMGRVLLPVGDRADLASVGRMGDSWPLLAKIGIRHADNSEITHLRP